MKSEPLNPLKEPQDTTIQTVKTIKELLMRSGHSVALTEQYLTVKRSQFKQLQNEYEEITKGKFTPILSSLYYGVQQRQLLFENTAKRFEAETIIHQLEWMLRLMRQGYDPRVIEKEMAEQIEQQQNPTEEGEETT